MTTAETIERNRANAQHSTGPRTSEGKAASSQNARKHGLSGKLILKTQAEAERFQKRIAEVARYYKLANPLASATIEALVTAEFRRAQAYEAEQNVLVQLKLQVIDELPEDAPDPSDEELDGLARLKDAQTTRLLPQLNRHYVAADRSWHKNYKTLTEMQAAETRPSGEMSDADLLAEAFRYAREALAQNEPTDDLLMGLPTIPPKRKGNAA